MKKLITQTMEHLQALNIGAKLEDNGSIGFDINMENSMLSVKIICDERESRVMLFVEASFIIPAVKYAEVLSIINHIHQNEYSSAHLFVNTENGHLFSQVVLNADTNNCIDFDVLRYALCDACYLIDSYYQDFMKVLIDVDPVRMAIGKPKKNRPIL